MTMGKYGAFANADVDSLEDIADIDVAGFSVLWLHFTVATASLSAFSVQYKLGGAGYVIVAAAGSKFTTPSHPVLAASGDLTGAGVGEHWVKLDVSGVQKVKIRAAGTSSVVSGYFSKG